MLLLSALRRISQDWAGFPSKWKYKNCDYIWYIFYTATKKCWKQTMLSLSINRDSFRWKTLQIENLSKHNQLLPLLTFRSVRDLHQKKKKLVLVLLVLGTTWTWHAKKAVVYMTEFITIHGKEGAQAVNCDEGSYQLSHTYDCREHHEGRTCFCSLWTERWRHYRKIWILC